jgi:small-conductance mechanosensitive channel
MKRPRRAGSAPATHQRGEDRLATPRGRRPRPRRRRARHYRPSARRRLRRFGQGSLLAVVLVTLFLFVLGVEEAPAAPADDPPVELADAADAGEAVDQAAETLRELGRTAWALLPKIAIGIAFLLAAWALARGLRWVVQRATGSWARAAGVGAVLTLVVWAVAIIAGLAVIVGDARAVAGSVGILGLALSWALQAPIESFTGWLLNSFRSYYRVGDRIAVGDVFGDVARIDMLTTTVWEAGGPDKPVQGAQPTGALVTFPNSELLRANVVNYSRDFPAVWDEVTVGVTNESDLPAAIEACRSVAEAVIGEYMSTAAAQYRALLERSHLAWNVGTVPEVYAAPAESWTDLTVRYLVPLRERRRWSSELYVALSAELSSPRHEGRIVPAYPQQRLWVTGGPEPGDEG